MLRAEILGILRSMRPHSVVEDVVKTYLEAVDTEAPGLLEGLYLTGSVALGEFRPHNSDIDFIAVTAHQSDASDLAALHRAHRRLQRFWPRLYFDGLYVTWDDFAQDPSSSGQAAYSYKGKFHARGGGPADPVAWHTLAHHGVQCRGPRPSTLKIRVDADGLARWTLNNLDTYWRALLDHSSRFLHPQRLVATTSWGVAWIVLGISRLHYTLATGGIVSKEAAGCYALETFPAQWHPVLNEGLRIRRSDRARADMASALAELVADFGIGDRRVGGRSLYRTPFERRRDAVAFGYMVISDAFSRYGRGPAAQLGL